MKLLVLNVIPYSSVSAKIPKIDSLDDTMIIGQCKEFANMGIDTTLYLCGDYKPLIDKEYNFKIIYDKAVMPKIFWPHKVPLLKNLKKFLKKNKDEFDYVITSEGFQTPSYYACKIMPEKTFVWQEISKHYKFMKSIPSKWYFNCVYKKKFANIPVIPRSDRAKEFASAFSNNVKDEIIEHGTDLSLFCPKEKKKQFIVLSRMIATKRIDKILDAFFDFCEKFDNTYELIIIGDGEMKESLLKQANESVYVNNVRFLGKMKHEELVSYLSESLALLIYTELDNNMISVVESIACGTPVITTSVPCNCSYIKQYNLGIVNDDWTFLDLNEIINHNGEYVKNCLDYREKLSYAYKAKQFLKVIEQEKTRCKK